MTEKILTGKIVRERIVVLEAPRVSDEILLGFRLLGDPVSAVSDALDEIGVHGQVAASALMPTMPGVVIVGSALTLHNVVRVEDPMINVRARDNRMAEIEAHNLARPGDVLVIQGVADVSNMGGVGSQIGKRQGELGAVIDGGIRDVNHSRSVGYPIWATGRTPLTGKWRLETIQINGSVVICGVRVHPGDLVVADDTGVCFVPRERAAEVLAYARKKTDSEEAQCARVDAGVSVPELAGVKRAPNKE